MNNKTLKLILIIITSIILILISLIIVFIMNTNRNENLNSSSEEKDEPAISEITPLPEIKPETPSPQPEPDPTPEPESESEPEPEPEDIIIDINEMYPELNDSLDSISKKYNSVAVSLAYYDGDMGEYYIYRNGYSDRAAEQLVDENTKFRVASLAKLVTVICAMTLVDSGDLDLDEDISVYLGYEVRNRRFPDTPVTSRMLMQHISSIHDSSDFQSSLMASESKPIQELLEMRSTFGSWEPGTRFEYTNFGYAALGAVCEIISGKVLDTLAREVIFEPLEIDAAFIAENLQDTENIAVIYNYSHRPTRTVEAQLKITGSGLPGHDHNFAQGGLMISAIDYAKILNMLGNKGSLHGAEILTPRSVQEINNTNVQGRAYEQGLATRYSHEMFAEDEGFFWHTGSAYGIFAQYMYSADGTNRGVVVITTGANTNRLSNRMFEVSTDLSIAAWRYIEENP